MPNSLFHEVVSKVNMLERRVQELEEQERAFGGIGARVYSASATTISDATFTKLTFEAERFDTNDLHDTTSNTGRLTCKTAGKYLIIASISWASNTTNVRGIEILLNNSTVIGVVYPYNPGAAASFTQNCVTIYDLEVNDYVEVRVYQNSGGDLDVESNSNYSPEFMMYLLP